MKLRFLARILTISFTTSLLVAAHASAGKIIPQGNACLAGQGTVCFVSKNDGIAGPGGNDTEKSVELALKAALGQDLDVMAIGAGLSIDTAKGTWSYKGNDAPSFLTIKSSTYYNLIDVQGKTSGTWTTPTGQGLSHATLWKNANGGSVVPEPSAGLVFAMGFTLVGAAIHKRRAR